MGAGCQSVAKVVRVRRRDRRQFNELECWNVGVERRRCRRFLVRELAEHDAGETQLRHATFKVGRVGVLVVVDVGDASVQSSGGEIDEIWEDCEGATDLELPRPQVILLSPRAVDEFDRGEEPSRV